MSKAIALSGGMKLPAKLQKQLADAAQAEAAGIASSGGRFISAKDGKFTFQGNKLDNPLDVVVAGYTNVNAWYGGVLYNPDSPSSPVCWAISSDDKNMVPSNLSPDKQAETCAECWANQFGSAEKGDGKACSNGIRVAVFPVDSIKAGEHAIVKISATGIRSFRKYLEQLTKVARVPSYAVITSLQLEDKVVEASLSRGLPAKTISLVDQLRPTVQSDLLADFTPMAADAGKKKKASGSRRMKVVKKGKK